MGVCAPNCPNRPQSTLEGCASPPVHHHPGDAKPTSARSQVSVGSEGYVRRKKTASGVSLPLYESRCIGVHIDDAPRSLTPDIARRTNGPWLRVGCPPGWLSRLPCARPSHRAAVGPTASRETSFQDTISSGKPDKVKQSVGVHLPCVRTRSWAGSPPVNIEARSDD